MNCRTLDDVGGDLGLSAQRAAQIRNQGLDRIRKSRVCRKLQESYETLYSVAVHSSGLNSFKLSHTSSTERIAILLAEYKAGLQKMLNEGPDRPTNGPDQTDEQIII